MNNETYKYISEDGLVFYESTIKERLGKKVDKEFKTGSSTDYKVLSDNNLTDELVQKILDAGSSSFNGDYNSLTSIPTLDGTEIKGALTKEGLGIASQEDLDALEEELENTVKTSGAQSVAGVKTFTSSPIVPTPTTDTQAAHKKYVDDAAKTAETNANGYTDIEVGKVSANVTKAQTAAENAQAAAEAAQSTADTNKSNITSVTNRVETLEKAGYQTASDVEGILEEKGYATESWVTGKGYQTASQVESIVTGKGYQTAAQVDAAIEAKGYQTEEDVEDILSGKGYATESWVEAKKYLTEANLAGYAKESWVEGKGYQTKQQVEDRIQEIIGSAPEVLDTLEEIAKALGDDPNFAATITAELAKKVDKTSLVAVSNQRIQEIVNSL